MFAKHTYASFEYILGLENTQNGTLLKDSKTPKCNSLCASQMPPYSLHSALPLTRALSSALYGEKGNIWEADVDSVAGHSWLVQGETGMYYSPSLNMYLYLVYG